MMPREMEYKNSNSAKAVLVVDDEPGIREGCRRVLEPQGFHVADGRYAARRAGANSIAQIRRRAPGCDDA